MWTSSFSIIAEEDFLLLSASGFEQVPQLVQINAAFTLVQLCLPAFELIYGAEPQKKSNHPKSTG